MNGLDPAGMHEMRDMIQVLVGEGRTVVLISELLAGSSIVVKIDCSEPERAVDVVEGGGVDAIVEVGAPGLRLTLRAGTSRDTIAELNRLPVESRISVYRVQERQASLESWFLQVTSRLGATE
jgi:hypothetical protein